MGFIRNTVGAITGSAGAEAAKEGAASQMEAAQLGIQEQRAAREQITQQLSPFREAGAGVLGGLTDIAGQPISTAGLPEAQLQQLGQLPSVMPGDIGQDSLFQALKRQAISGIESSAAARGKLMSGTTPQAIAEQVQNLALQRAGQIQGMNLAARQQMVDERGQLFGQDIAARQALLGERVGQQERQYQQLFNLAGLGQASAAQQAANIQGSASNIANLLGQSANAYAAGQMGAANARAQGIKNLAGLGVMGAGAAGLGGLTTAQGVIGGALLMSDIRVKEDIKRVGETDSGLPVYTFRYKGDSTVHMGVMAQDVEKSNPDAVTEIDGIKHVNYGAL